MRSAADQDLVGPEKQRVDGPGESQENPARALQGVHRGLLPGKLAPANPPSAELADRAVGNRLRPRDEGERNLLLDHGNEPEAHDQRSRLYDDQKAPQQRGNQDDTQKSR